MRKKKNCVAENVQMRKIDSSLLCLSFREDGFLFYSIATRVRGRREGEKGCEEEKSPWFLPFSLYSYSF